MFGCLMPRARKGSREHSVYLFAMVPCASSFARFQLIAFQFALVQMRRGWVGGSVSWHFSCNYDNEIGSQVVTRGGGGGILNKVLYGEAPPRVPNPYPFIYHF